MEEQKIIEEGLKTNTKQDIICYIGMAVIFIMIFIPPIFRVVFYDSEAKNNDVEIVYLNMVCQKAMYRDGKKILITVNNIYKDSIIQSSVAEYNYEQEEPIAEVNEFLFIESDDIGKEELETGYRFTFDYTNPRVFELEELTNYRSPAPAQMNYYKNKGYACETTSEVKKEERK